VSKLDVGKVQYSPMCYENGGTVDDLIVYQLSEEQYFLVVNAANKNKDYEWLKTHEMDGVTVVDRSDEYGQIAIQGPKAEKILQNLTQEPLNQIKFFRFKEIEVSGCNAIVSRTGYTGEDGFEVYANPSDTKVIWEELEKAGKDDNLQLIGLGARDVLRFEVCLPLYGNELSPELTPLEARLNPFVKLNKVEDFMGKEVMQKQKEQGLEKVLVGFEMVDKGIPRTHYPLTKDGEEIGFVSSGSHSPTLGKALGLGFVAPEYQQEGTEIEVNIRKKKATAKIVKTPFYRRG